LLDHNFNSTPYTIGIEEELMLLDSESLDLVSGIDRILADVPAEREGQVKPELFQSVLEIATAPCANVAEAGAELGELRRMVRDIAAGHGMLVGAAGTHPFARCNDQRIVERERYVELHEELGSIAAHELIFGTHVHVGIDSPEKAVYMADGIRRHLPLMLALSSNSPWWEGERTGLHSSRTPVFRAFPRVGIPPHYGGWEIYSRRVSQMVRAGAIEDYTFLWWDVRPHPNLGTVETRIFDQSSRLEDTVAFAALTVALAHRFATLFDAEEPLVEQPWELIDDNKVRACVRGMEGDLVDFQRGCRTPARELADRLLAEIDPSVEALGVREQLQPIHRILAEGTGARAQLDFAGPEDGEDLREVVRGMVVLDD